MTCFWDGILSSLKNFDFKESVNSPRPRDAFSLASLLKVKNKKTLTVFCNGVKLTDKQIDENYESVSVYDPNRVRDGYLCSTMDPFLCLICDLFRVSIIHNYNNNIISYSCPNPKKLIKFSSDMRHFRYIG